MMNDKGDSKSVKGSTASIEQSSATILVYTPTSCEYKTSDLLSVGAAIENILLRGEELGLGCLWIRDVCYSSDEIEKYYKVDAEYYLLCAVAVGYPKESPKKRPRKSLNEILYWGN